MGELEVDRVHRLALGEAEEISDPVVRSALKERLLRPEMHFRKWDYGKSDDQYPCWTVVRHELSGTAIVYSEHGHGRVHPWGLVALSDDWFGTDGGWFLKLEDAFIESTIARDLPIWDVVASDDSVIASSLVSDAAFALRDQLDPGSPRTRYHVRYRSRNANGVR